LAVLQIQEVGVPNYIVMSRFRDGALATIEEMPARSAAGRATVEALGCKILGAYLTAGRYDIVRVFEAPDDVTMAKVTLALGVRGHEETETLRAFSPEEMGEILKSQMPAASPVSSS
jgi:uncharacterized protein with GYD domain